MPGKTVTRVIPAGPAVERTRQQLHECHRFRELVQQLIAVSEQICDLQLQQQEESTGVSLVADQSLAWLPPRQAVEAAQDS